MSTSAAQALDSKSARLNGQLNGPTPQQVTEEQVRNARIAIDNYNSQPQTEEPAHAKADEPHQDSIKANKRANPQVGRTVKPQGKDRSQEVRKEG